MIVMAATKNLDRSLTDFTETMGRKKNKRLSEVRFPINYSRNDHYGTEYLKVVGLPFFKVYEFLPGHIESIESYARFTTNWKGCVVSMLTPFAIMEHAQMQITGSYKAPYLNLN